MAQLLNNFSDQPVYYYYYGHRSELTLPVFMGLPATKNLGKESIRLNSIEKLIRRYTKFLSQV